ncbi:MAG: DUF11 domain-containing protein [Ardenticatenaceae bacterium]
MLHRTKAILMAGLVCLTLFVLLLASSMTLVAGDAFEQGIGPGSIATRPEREAQQSALPALSQPSAPISGVLGSPNRDLGLSAVYMWSNVGQPWGRSANEARLNEVLGAGSWQKERYETVDAASVFSSNTDFVFMEGSEDNADELEDFLNANSTTIEAWVYQGGCLLLNAAPDEGDGMSFGFGVTLNGRAGSGTGSAVDPTHPVFNGPHSPVGTAFSGSPLSLGTLSGEELDDIIRNQDGDPILGEKSWGGGGVLFGALTLPLFTDWQQPEHNNLHRNIIHYATDCAQPQADMSVEMTASPNPVDRGSPLTYTITVSNNGLTNTTGVQLTDTLPAAVTFASITVTQGTCSEQNRIVCQLGDLANGANATVTIVVTPTTAGIITNTATVSSPLFDPNPNDNIARVTTTVIPEVVEEEVEPISGVALAGPEVGGINTSYTFTATVHPTNTGPITYTWVAPEQKPIVHAEAGPVVTATFSWNRSGPKEITVKVSSSSGEVSDYHSIDLATNEPPEAREVTITPSDVVTYGLSVAPTGTNILVNYIYYDKENQAEAKDKTRIRWTRDDQVLKQEQPLLNDSRTVTKTLITIPQEQWCATVEPHDGTSYGKPAKACVYIEKLPGNLLPKAEKVEIPAHPSEEVTLTLSYEPSDVDGTIDKDQTQLRWYLDGILQPGFNDQEKVPGQQTQVGQVWCAKVRVSDGTDFGVIADSNCGVVSPKGNTLPVISNPRITPTVPTDSDDLTVSYGYVDPDGDEEDKTQTIIRWLRDGQLQPQFNNQRLVDGRFTVPGEKWWAVIQPHDGKNYGRFDITPPVHISEGQKKTPPEVIDVKINPAEPSPDQDLRLTYEFSDPDNDAEDGTIIRWYKSDSSLEQPQHMPKYDNLTVLPSADTAASDVWFAVVIPSDGKDNDGDGNQDYGPDVPAHSVTIREANSPPEARNVVLAPAMPGDDQDLVVEYKYYDKNDDPEDATEIKWTINGDEKAALPYLNDTRIPAADTFVGQKWCVQVTPHDGNKPGEPVQSNCVTIAKAGTDEPPSVSNIHIKPSVPRSSDNLTLHYEYNHPDLAEEENTVIHWYRRGVHLKLYDDQTVIPAHETSPGDTWSATVRPRDRSGTTGNVKSSPRVIINTAPQVLTVAMDPEEAVTNQDLTVSYEYEDQDGHPEDEPRITWHKNGAEQPQFENQWTIPASETSPGERWQATIYAFDGYEYSQKLRGVEIKIGFRLYVPIMIRQIPSPPDEPTPTPSPTNTPTPTPSPTPTPAGYEPNNTSQEAYGPLVFGQFYEAYPEDQDDWYYVTFSDTTSLEVIVNNYAPAPGGQVVVYQEYFNAEIQKTDRRLIANDGREVPNMQIPNEVDPNALKELPPGKYLIRVYTTANYSSDTLYQLKSDKKQEE